MLQITSSGGALSPRCAYIVLAKLIKHTALISPSILHEFIRAALRHRRRAKVIVILIPFGSVGLLDGLHVRVSGLQETVVVKPMAETGRPFA